VLGGELKRHAPALRQYGIAVERLGHGRDGWKVRISRTTPPADGVTAPELAGKP
jgi:hypothetical protein